MIASVLERHVDTPLDWGDGDIPTVLHQRLRILLAARSRVLASRSYLDELENIKVKFAQFGEGGRYIMEYIVTNCIYRDAFGECDKEVRDLNVWIACYSKLISLLTQYGGPKIIKNFGNYRHYNVEDCVDIVEKFTKAMPGYGNVFKYILDRKTLGMDCRLSLITYIFVMMDKHNNRELISNLLDILLCCEGIDMQLFGDLGSTVGNAARFTCTMPIMVGNGITWLEKAVAMDCRYIGELASRANYKVDVEAELLTRTQPGPNYCDIDNDNYMTFSQLEDQDELYEIARDVTCEFAGLRSMNREGYKDQPKIATWEEFWKSRGKWIATGSAPGYKIERVNRITGKLERLSINKRMALETLSERGCKNIIYQAHEAMTWSRHAWKYENRKNRSLWNTAPVHYLISSRIFNECEWKGEKPIWAYAYQSDSVQLATDALILEKQNKHKDFYDLGKEAGANDHLMMWDFSDFNIYHSLRLMAYIVRTLGEEYEKIAPGELFQESAEWIANSTLNSYMEDQDNKMWIKAARGLLTGSRGTSLINTLCNRIYYIFCMRRVKGWLARMKHHEDENSVMLAQGDDQAIISTILANYFLICAYTCSGLSGQGKKLLFGQGEFLRYTYDGGCKSGDAIRMIPNMWAGEFSKSAEMLGKSDIYSNAQSIEDNIMKFNRRFRYESKVFNNIIRECKYKRHCTLHAVGREVTVDRNIVRAPTFQDGLGVRYQREAECIVKAKLNRQQLNSVRAGFGSRGRDLQMVLNVSHNAITQDVYAVARTCTNRVGALRTAGTYIESTSVSTLPPNEISAELASKVITCERMKDEEQNIQFAPYELPDDNSPLQGMCVRCYELYNDLTAPERTGIDNFRGIAMWGVIDNVSSLPLTPLRDLLIWGIRGEEQCNMEQVMRNVISESKHLAITFSNAINFNKNGMLPTWWLAGDVEFGSTVISDEIGTRQNSILRKAVIWTLEQYILEHCHKRNIDKKLIQWLAAVMEYTVGGWIVQQNAEIGISFRE